MKERYLEVTFRKGKALAAYLYLPREAGTKSARTHEMAPGVLVDYDANNKAIGIEITAPTQVTPDQVNNVLSQIGFDSLTPGELAPLSAA